MAYTNPITGEQVYPRFTVPESFGDAASYSDQLLILAHGLYELQTSVDGDHSEIYNRIAEVAASVTALAQTVADSVVELERQIDELSVGVQVYDVFTGAYRENQDCMRNTVRWLAVHAITVGELNSLDNMDTVTDLANCGLNCIGLAIVGNWLVSQGYEVPERYKQEGRVTGFSLTAADYPKLMIDDTSRVYLS